VCIAFVYFMIYETKGLTLEQVDELYGIVTKAWKSKTFRPQVSFQEVEDAGGKGGRSMSMAEMAEETQRRKSAASAEAEKV
jgi:MFS transporter, SP family, sugar:H+ symporter